MCFYSILLFSVLTIATESRFEDFVIKGKNDLQRFGDSDYVDDESYEFEDNSILEADMLRQLSLEELDVIYMLGNIPLENMSPDFLQNLQKYYDMMHSSNCFEDEDNLLPYADAHYDNDIDFYNTLQIQ